MDILEQIKQYRPWNDQEANDRAVMLQWLAQDHDLFSRSNPFAHFTASAWVVSPDRSQVLMAHHNLYHSWAWLGGHADGEQDLLAVALREAQEESGISATPVSEDIFSVEILPVSGHEKKGEYLPSHLHLNVTFLLEANPSASIRPKEDENSRVGWFGVEDALTASSEPWLRDRIYRKLCEKVQTLR